MTRYTIDVTVHEPVCLTAEVRAETLEEAFALAREAVLARVRAEPFADPRVLRIGEESLTMAFDPAERRVECYLAETEEENGEPSLMRDQDETTRREWDAWMDKMSEQEPAPPSEPQ